MQLNRHVEQKNCNFRLIWLLIVLILADSRQANATIGSALNNGVVGDPKVDCMEDRVRLTIRTERPFNGRIFVKGMIENEKCVRTYRSNAKQAIDFQLNNGECNMRRSRKLGPEQRGVEQSITVIISFHNVFITKVDRAYRCTCFYMEADKVVTNHFDVSMLPTTDLIDTAKMPLCTYTVRRGSVNGPIVSYAVVGEPVFHVWSCDSDMFSMLVHNCFVDDGAGKDRKPLIDEQGCTIDPVIVADLTYNAQANLAYSEVNVFKFADKMVTYFQCAISTCMVSEGMCKGKTPPRCSVNSRRRRSHHHSLIDGSDSETNESRIDTDSRRPRDDYVMDLAAEKIVVLDLEDSAESAQWEKPALPKSDADPSGWKRRNEFLNELRDTVDEEHAEYRQPTRTVCFSYLAVTLMTSGLGFSAIAALATVGLLFWRQRTATTVKINGDSGKY